MAIGLDQVKGYRGRLAVEPGADAASVVLRFSVSFECADPARAVRVLQIVGGAGAGMGAALRSKFQPVSSLATS